jgi:hypothetical protein
MRAIDYRRYFRTSAAALLILLGLWVASGLFSALASDRFGTGAIGAEASHDARLSELPGEADAGVAAVD